MKYLTEVKAGDTVLFHPPSFLFPEEYRAPVSVRVVGVDRGDILADINMDMVRTIRFDRLTGVHQSGAEYGKITVA